MERGIDRRLADIAPQATLRTDVVLQLLFGSLTDRFRFRPWVEKEFCVNLIRHDGGGLHRHAIAYRAHILGVQRVFHRRQQIRPGRAIALA